MKNFPKSQAVLSALTVLVVGCGTLWPRWLEAQVPGNNTVVRAVVGGTSISSSSAYIDASGMTGTNAKTDICAKINAALGSITSSFPSAVIDARGIVSPNLACPVGTTPWVYGSNTFAKAATILLPVGTILINAPWVMPSGARIVGEGGGAASASATVGVTTIQACKTGVTGCTQNLPAGAMISMGSSSTTFCPANICTGVSIENVWLDGQGLASVNGIANSFSQEQSTVKHVTLYQLSATGLNIFLPSGTGSPQNSGPYEDIVCIPGTAAATGTTCARILSVSTRGLHGLTCINTSATIPTSAVTLNGPNNSLEDISVQGFQNGVRIGGAANAQNNILANISGGPGVSSVILISNSFTVTDLTMLGIGNGGTGGATDTITDNISVPSVVLTDAHVGIYALGEPVTAGGTTIGYTRFTTSPSVPSWVNGNGVPSNPCKPGSLYSNTTGQSGSTWYLCGPASTWSNVK